MAIAPLALDIPDGEELSLALRPQPVRSSIFHSFQQPTESTL